MANKKYKLSNLHKIKVHKNRWLIWAIAYVVMVTIAVVGYLKVSDINFETQFGQNAAGVSWRSYSDTRLGFSVRYPKNWGIESSSQSSVSFMPADSKQEGVLISEYPLSAEPAVRKSLKITSEKPITVDQVQGSIITNNLGQGVSETVVMLKKNNLLYTIAGPDNFVRGFLPNFHFITPVK
ncbi:MAG TPA: hypothetical protein VL306_02850 [Methylomirabilota bacterium]|nr:hypothetical protein [Methylomirabilota bacterium]